MLYIIGLGLNVDGISHYGLETVKRCKRVYLENYTIDFPYSEGELQDVIGKKIISANREKVESLEIVDESKKMNVCLLVYGSPLFATTHVSLIQEAKRLGIKYKLIYSSSIFDALGETGLQLYKFGKITSMPKFEANSFMEVVQNNQKIEAHSLILIDIGLEPEKAFEKLWKAAKNYKLELGKIIVCCRMGNRYQKIYYDTIKNLKEKEIQKPYCIIIPSKLHFVEKEVLENV